MKLGASIPIACLCVALALGGCATVQPNEPAPSPARAEPPKPEAKPQPAGEPQEPSEAAPVGALGPQDPSLVPEDVRASIQARLDAGENEGIIVGVVTPQGHTFYALGRSGAPNGRLDEQTLFEVGSVTKLFTALLLQEMVKAGELKLDDPISALLPEGQAAPSKNKKEISLRHLVSHCSGLPRVAPHKPKDEHNPYADFTENDLLAFLKEHELVREPGKGYEYSNLGMGLLGYLLGRKAGLDYEPLLVTRVLRPLGMGSTLISLGDPERARMAQGHVEGKAAPAWDFAVLSGAGALRSSAQDLLGFVSKYVKDEGSGPLAESLQEIAKPLRDSDHAGVKVGMGWHIAQRDEKQVLFHSGGTGGQTSFVGFNPNTKRGVVVLSSSNAQVDDLGLHLLESSLPLRAVEKPLALPEETLARYVGRYELAPEFHLKVSLEQGRLWVQATGQPSFPLYAKADSEFFLKVVDARLVFQMDPKGKVTGVVLHQGGRSPLGKKVE